MESNEQILLVWWEMEEMNCFLLPKEDITKEQLKILHAMGGKYMGTEDMDGLSDNEGEKLALMVCNPETFEEQWASSPELVRFIGNFWVYKINDPGIFRTDNVTLVVTSGQAV